MAAATGATDNDGVPSIFARHNELYEWRQKDRHRFATAVLAEPRGRRIAELMGIKGDLADPAKYQQWRQCLSCHGMVVDDEKHARSSWYAGKDRIASGVGCLVCHGPYSDWVDEHIKRGKNRWGDFTREQKQQQFGLRDLWDPVKRAELCCSCHVGNAAESKVVTHEMYAAGHPPLPSFELVTYTDAMPRHWETMKEKYTRVPSAKATYDKVYHLGEDAGQQRLRLLLTSAVVSLRNSAQLIAAYAKADKPGGERDWPEFALYDCYACHHDLKSDSWRQKRGYAGKPGRPQMTEWPLALVPLVIPPEPPDAAADYHKKLTGLQTAFSKVPFGDPAVVAPAADALAAWSDATLRKLAQSAPRSWRGGQALDPAVAPQRERPARLRLGAASELGGSGAAARSASRRDC